MTGDQWTFLGVALASLLTFYGVLRKSRSDERVANRSASAAEVTALGVRLDGATERIEDLERLVRGFRNYVAEDHQDHREHNWPVRPLPPELA